MDATSSSLAAAFLAAGGAAGELSPEIVEASLRAIFDEGMRTWDVGATPERFAAHVATLVEDGGALAELHPDLVLVSAVLSGDREAITHVDGLVRGFAARAALPGVAADELAQVVRAQLLLPQDGGTAPKLTQYAGRGPLGAWLRVLITRTGLTLQRAENRRGAKLSRDEDLADMTVGDSTPELQMIRSAYAAPFREAFGEALAALPAEDRNLLRLHLVDGLSIDRLGALHNVHRATAARRLTRAREAVLAKTRELLEQRLRISQSDFSSLVGLMLSRLEISSSFLGS